MNQKQGFEETKQRLLNQGTKIFQDVEGYRKGIMFHTEFHYSDWKDSCLKFFRKHAIKNYEADFSDQDDFPEKGRYSHTSFDYTLALYGQREAVVEIEEFIKSFREKLRYLRDIDGGKILIHIDEKSNAIYIKGTGLRYQVRKNSGGTSNRFNYILKIIKSKKPLLAKKLIGTTSPISKISTEIRKINKSFKEKLELEEGLIINEGGPGYRLNTARYIVKK